MKNLRLNRLNQFFVFLAFVLIFIVFTKTNIFAKETPVRIGLSQWQNVGEISIFSGGIEIGYESNDEFIRLFGIVNNNGGFSLTSCVFSSKKYGEYLSYTEAKQAADEKQAAGQNAVPVFCSNNIWSLYIEDYSGSAVGDAAVSLKLKSGEIAFIFDNPAYSLCIRPNPNLAAIQLTDRSYRGFVEVKTKNGKVSAVNVIPLEEYLYSVITSEMPKDWHAEALKAQAVSARSYTINRASKQPHGEGYDLCDDVHCQAYGGYGNESTEGRAAVDATRGICAYYNNEVIEAVFFSSSGGMTDDSENVWSNPQPYLRGVFDIAESEPLQWSRTFTSAELSALATAKGANIGSVTSVSIVKTGSTGRVLQLAVNGTIGSIVLSKEEVRTFFSTTKEGSLRSRNFVIANGISTIVPQNVAVINSYGITSATAANLYAIGAVETPQKLTSNSVQTVTSTGVSTVSLYSVTASASNETAFTFTGKGWGHGVGLNQHGAKAMAEAGYNFEQILKHYYTNIELAQYISQSDL